MEAIGSMLGGVVGPKSPLDKLAEKEHVHKTYQHSLVEIEKLLQDVHDFMRIGQENMEVRTL